ncbi:MAG: class I SAM-dependent methyltransferase [Spirochaetaceae bacterium]|nr:class I SAM-dependent methyltransferase [Spirochaetaceae bacterium]
MNKTAGIKDIRAVDAKFEAQKIAFGPLVFHAARALIDFGILRAVSDAGAQGLSCKEIAEKSGISLYGVSLLAEMALGMKVFLRAEPSDSEDQDEHFILGKTGFFLLEDDMTRVNMNFVYDICYQGASFLPESIKTGEPLGLSVFGKQHKTIYEALSSLPEQSKKSWFEFDHFYSDIAFPCALPIVFDRKPKNLVDVGGNTAKWAISCCSFNTDVKITIVDLPGQTALAEKNAQAAGFSDRICVYPCDILDENTEFPKGADAVWMSQFLDCFSLSDITLILKKIRRAVDRNADIFILEPLLDMQKFEAAAYSLQAASLYFSCMANGKSTFYHFRELKDAVERAGFDLSCAHHNIGSNAYSLLCFKKI